MRKFAELQASAAQLIYHTLSAEWHEFSTKPRRVQALLGAYRYLMQWRYRLAQVSPIQIGIGIPMDPERFRATIDEHGPNYDRIGRVGRLRANCVWNETGRVFTGGEITPAYRIMLEYGKAAESRFAHSGLTGDVLNNPVRLPDGSTVVGNRLVRGAAARDIACDLVARVARRGGDTRHIETGGDPIYAVTADNAARSEIFSCAIDLLAGAEFGDVAAWQQARFLLYQSPKMKKGSDSVIRTFLVAVGAILFERPRILVHDVDLRCLVLGQDSATVMPHDLELCSG
ncbi:hypothetical protein AB0M22_05715 [Nocardia sp. NPDC051756]|uniref:hypothetical protein n=1 Tax=Nocardia sp. NPDC051756 TaxID=3154751 RepID=UPI00341FF433